MTEPPWRRQVQPQFPGVPAWGVTIAAMPADPFAVSSLAEVTPDWALAGADGSGVRVCVVDSGIDGSHPLVGGVDQAVTIVAGADGEFSIGDVTDSKGGDTAGHGTACAGVIRSISPAVSLTSVRVLTDGIFGQGGALLAGLSWAIDAGFDVINLSISTTKEQLYPALHELADRAYFRRSILVASAHNMPIRSFPWTFASVISVASHDEADPRAYYYNPSPPVEFYARGVRVRVPWPGGGEKVVTGNSFAAPHIAGICALILSKHPWMTPFQVKSALYLTARNVAQPTGGVPSSD